MVIAEEARNIDIGERVFQLRDERDWSQAELARRAGISRTTMSHVENGIVKNPSSPTLRRLARAFDMTVMSLLTQPEDWHRDNNT